MNCHIGRDNYSPTSPVCASCELQGAMVCVPKEKTRSKYRNERVVIDGMKFDSKREAARWQQLRMMEKAGKITDLRRQVPFELATAVIINGRVKPALRYVADFVYNEDGSQVVEDAKGMLTDVYRIKRHLMLSVHGIAIREVR